MTEQEQEQERQDGLTRRDGETLILLGVFLDALSIPVMIGAFFAERSPQNWVCLVSGVVLLAIGIAFVLHGKRVLKRLSA